MTRLIAVFLLLISLRVVAAPIGTITGMEIETNGCVVRVWGEGMAANLIGFQNGFVRTETIVAGLTNWSYVPSASTNGLIITGTVPGFTSAGIATTYTETNYGTKLSRLSTPLQISNSVVAVNTTNWMARVFLSGYFFAEDTGLLGYVSAGGFATTNAVTNCLSASAIVVTNSSTQTYHGTKAIANWTWPGWHMITGATFTVKAVGFHSSAREGKPLACMRFITMDETGGIVGDLTNTVSTMTRDVTNFSGLSFGEYVAEIPIATLQDGDQLRTDFIAFPWRGTTNACLDTRLNIDEGITRKPTSQTNFLIRLAGYTNLIAAVDPTFGSDSNGRVTNGVDSALLVTNHYFASIGGAEKALSGTNWNKNGIVGSSGTTIFVSSNTVRPYGTSLTRSNTPKAYVTIKPLPGHTVRLNWRNSSVDDNNGIFTKVKFEGISTTWSNTITAFNNVPFLWWDSCPLLISTSTIPIIASTGTNLTWITRSTIGEFQQGLTASAATRNESFILRDVVLTNFAGVGKISTWAGVRTTTGTTNYNLLTDETSQGPPVGYEILYNCALYNSTKASAIVNVYGGNECKFGAAIVQNIFEKAGNNEIASATVGSSSSGSHSTNILIFHNVFVGERVADWFSSSSEATNRWRILHSMKNNIIDLSGFKKDYDGPDADRIGNWSVMYQVNCSGNIFIECVVNTAAGAFPTDWQGLYGTRPAINLGTNVISYASFVNRQATPGPATYGAGFGDYHINPNGPPVGKAVDWILPYDIGGRARQANGTSGAWEFVPLKARIFGKTIIRNGP